MIELFGAFAIGLVAGAVFLGIIMIILQKRNPIEDDDFDLDIDVDEDEFEDLEEIFSHDEDFIPEEEEIKLPKGSEFRIPTGDDVKRHKKAMEDLKNGNEEK